MNIVSLYNKYGVNEDEGDQALDRIINKEAILFSMSGKMGVGKDTVGRMISKAITNEGFNLINVSFGYLIREEIEGILNDYGNCENKEMYAINAKTTKEEIDKLADLMKGSSVDDRTASVREALQFWGTNVRRKQEETYWINKMSEFIVDKINKGFSVNITDARFPNEVALVEDFYGKVIRLEAKDEVLIERIEIRDGIKVDREILAHSSETALDTHNFNIVLDATKDPNELSTEGFNYITN